jgi:predicted O-linked N-acetylglucosamine transferase (SPINDLY family)
MNNFAKVNDRMLDTWAQLLKAVPTSRLLIHAKAGSHRARVENRLAADGIDVNRIGFINRLPIEQYFSQYLSFDVALDTYPYGGGTTTCDALWMGVPVVSRFGQRGVSRAGLSILSNAGLPELVAETDEQYVQIATALAADRPRLAELRATLRDRLRGSPLMDAPRFARNVEQAFRTMWRRWCERTDKPQP